MTVINGLWMASGLCVSADQITSNQSMPQGGSLAIGGKSLLADHSPAISRSWFQVGLFRPIAALCFISKRVFYSLSVPKRAFNLWIFFLCTLGLTAFSILSASEAEVVFQPLFSILLLARLKASGRAGCMALERPLAFKGGPTQNGVWA